MVGLREAKSGFPSEYLDEIRGMGPQWLVSRGEGPIQGRFTDREEVIGQEKHTEEYFSIMA